MLSAEVISIGDEITTGQRLDTNSQWLSQQLGLLGARVMFHTTVGDDLAANVAVFQTAVDRADLVVATGGLGPTADDLTREALAGAFGRELELHGEMLVRIRALFARRGRDMPERNVVQAMFPAGSRPIPNPHGTAPGIDLAIERKGRRAARCFCLPGVPAEMQEMWTATVAPAILDWQGHDRRVMRQRQIKCFGVGESDLEKMLPDLIRRGRQPEVGITVHQATISLRIIASGGSEAECDALIEPTVRTIHECLGHLVFGEGDDELPEVVVRMMGGRGLQLAVIEEATAGLVGYWLRTADPAGRVFRAGRVLPPGELPHERLSADSLRQIIRQCQREFPVDRCLVVGSACQSAGEVVAKVPWAIVHDQVLAHGWLPYSGHPEIVVPRAAKSALNELRKLLLAE